MWFARPVVSRHTQTYFRSSYIYVCVCVFVYVYEFKWFREGRAAECVQWADTNIATNAAVVFHMEY